MLNILFLFLMLLPACTQNTENSVKKNDVFVQLTASSDTLALLIEAITPIINSSIKQELGLDQEYVFEFFLPKKRFALTVYYLNGVLEHGVDQLITIVDRVSTQDRSLDGVGVALTPRVEFFAGRFGINDELVIMIDDPHAAVSALHTAFKSAFHNADDEYRSTHTYGFYDVVKSERYPYVPHVGLGRIRSASIKEHNKSGVRLEKIQERIKRDVTAVIGRLFARQNTKLVFDSIVVFNPQKREVYKEIRLV
jgi:hypothetical protein